jgi:hypothetical protein
MDLNFFLDSMKQIKDLEYCLTNLSTLSEGCSFIDSKCFCNSSLKKLALDKQLCRENINKLCVHVFIKDFIDTDVEKSQMIEYCSVCEFIK